MNKKLEEVAKALQALAEKYGIPEQEITQVAKICGAAVAEQGLDTPAQEPATPMDTGADELAGALGGR